MSSEKPLTVKQQLGYVGLGVLIAITYTVWFVVFTQWMDENEIEFVIIPFAYAQILPFEQQLEQIRNPEECTRKVVQGGSAQVPFSIKVFYDTSTDVKQEFKQQGTSFPVRQTTNQVMTFYTDEADQYEIYIEVNYPDAKPRQIYIEYLSNNAIVQSTQEKFDTRRFCMNLFANTVIPTPVPTKEEIFGESLTFIGQIPAMVTAFNTNTQTQATGIAYMWLLILGVVILSLVTLISSFAGKRRFDSKVNDLDDSIGQVNTMTLSMDNLVRSVSEPLDLITKNQNKILHNQDLILDKYPSVKVEEKKESRLKKIITFRKKKPDEELMTEAEVVALAEEKPDTETTEEVLKELQSGAEGKDDELDELIEKAVEPEPSGGFVIGEEEEKVLPPTPPSPKEEERILKSRPKDFLTILQAIDFENRRFKDDMFDEFEYNQLNESYGWIVKYRKWALRNRADIPLEFMQKQEVAEKVIYYAIFAKMEQRKRNGK
jgi:hypothetical protein